MAENEAAIQIAPSSTFIDRDVGLSALRSNEKRPTKVDKKIEWFYLIKIESTLEIHRSLAEIG